MTAERLRTVRGRHENTYNKPSTMFRSNRSPAQAAGIVLLMLAIFLIDAFTPLDVAIAVLYVVVVLCATNVWSRRGVLVTGVACVLLTVAAFAINHGPELSRSLARCVVSMSAVGITTLLALAGLTATESLRRRSESLRISEALLASTQRLSRTSSFRFHSVRGITWWSDEAARIYALAPSEPPTIERMLTRCHPDDLPLVQEAIARVRRGEPSIELRHRLRMEDGAIKHVHIISSLTAASNGDFEYLGALMDVSAAHEAAEALHRAQAQLAHVTRVTTLGELAASIAHEVNQPLAAVATNGNACLRWLNRATPDLGEARMALDRILDDTRRASEVIRRIRALARRGDTQRRELDLNQVLNDTVALVQRELSAQRISLRLDQARELPAVLGDAVQLQQVLINLVMNAMQAIAAMPRGAAGGRRIDVATGLDPEGRVMVTVADTGPGLSEAQAGRLFEAFYTTKEDGMGMGLAICRSIVEAHGGRICALPQEDGRGARIAFSLPPARVNA